MISYFSLTIGNQSRLSLTIFLFLLRTLNGGLKIGVPDLNFASLMGACPSTLCGNIAFHPIIFGLIACGLSPFAALATQANTLLSTCSNQQDTTQHWVAASRTPSWDIASSGCHLTPTLSIDSGDQTYYQHGFPALQDPDSGCKKCA